MKVAVEVRFDKETRQWCVGMLASPWIASCGRTSAEAKRMFLEAFRAYFEAPKKVGRISGNHGRKIQLVTVA